MKNEETELAGKEEEEEEKLASLIQKCPNLRLVSQIHAHILTNPLFSTSTVSFALSKILCFAAYRNIHYAKSLLYQIPKPTIFAYNTLMRGFLALNKPSPEPILLFKQLVQKKYPIANTFTLSFVLKCCSVLPAVLEGEQVHKHVIASGFGGNLFVQTSLLNFYTKCEEIELGQKVFDEMSERTVVSWSAIIGGYSRVGMVNEALGSFREMQRGGFEPDEVTIVSVITVCAMSGALNLGSWLHKFIDRKGIKNNLHVSTALVSMYARSGCIEKAKEVFDAMPFKDGKAWSSMIVGFAMHGLAVEALQTFADMGEAKVEPDHLTLIGVLSACAHCGLVSEGRKYWSIMLQWGMEPSMEHYCCMVDLFCRANLLHEAFEFIQSMPIDPTPTIWRMLLVSCKKKRMLRIGETIAEKLLQLEPFNAENYILLSGLYASSSDWVKMSYVRREMRQRDIRAMPGCSSIEINGHVHDFGKGSWSHPEGMLIRNLLSQVAERVSEVRQEPWIATLLQDISNVEKQSGIWEHSERLAIGYGLLKTRAPTVIRVVKNLRVCVDCHEVIKTISKLYDREILVRDRIRFHKFAGGVCSCGDSW